MNYKGGATMGSQNRAQVDPKLQARIVKQQKRDHRVEHIYRRILHVIERIIATVTILVLIAALVIELYQMFTVEGYLADMPLVHSMSTTWKSCKALWKLVKS